MKEREKEDWKMENEGERERKKTGKWKMKEREKEDWKMENGGERKNTGNGKLRRERKKTGKWKMEERDKEDWKMENEGERERRMVSPETTLFDRRTICITTSPQQYG